MSKPESEVLVVGAGPVGLMAALALSRRGIRVEIVDQDDERRFEHGCALALHPGTLALLAQAGLAAEVIRQGQRVDTVGLFDRAGRKAELHLSKVATDFPFVVVLPQMKLEALLVRRLQEQGVKVLWSHRLTQLDAEGERAVVSLDRLGKEPGGYGIAGGNWVVDKTIERRPAFVIGADGQHSMVRRRIGITPETLREAELYGVLELQTGLSLGREVRIVLDDDTTSVLWPMGEGRCRFSFELGQRELPVSERERPLYGAERAFLRLPDDQVMAILHERAPWFDRGAARLEWSVSARFEQRLVNRFGAGRAWLAGDAAHVTGPVGAHSMNVGMREGVDLAARIAGVLREGAPRQLLEQYASERAAEWRPLMGLESGVGAGAGASDWIAARASRLLHCIPAAGPELGALLGQVGLEVTTTAPSATDDAPGVLA